MDLILMLNGIPNTTWGDQLDTLETRLGLCRYVPRLRVGSGDVTLFANTDAMHRRHPVIHVATVGLRPPWGTTTGRLQLLSDVIADVLVEFATSKFPDYASVRVSVDAPWRHTGSMWVNPRHASPAQLSRCLILAVRRANHYGQLSQAARSHASRDVWAALEAGLRERMRCAHVLQAQARS